MADAGRVRSELVEACNAHDESRIRGLNAEHAVLEAPGDVRLEGREAATQDAMAWLQGSQALDSLCTVSWKPATASCRSARSRARTRTRARLPPATFLRRTGG